MGIQEQYKIIGQLKTIKKQLNLICEKMGIETLPIIKIDKDKKEKKYPEKEMFVQGTGKLKNYE